MKSTKTVVASKTIKAPAKKTSDKKVQTGAPEKKTGVQIVEYSSLQSLNGNGKFDANKSARQMYYYLIVNRKDLSDLEIAKMVFAKFPKPEFKNFTSWYRQDGKKKWPELDWNHVKQAKIETHVAESAKVAA